MKPTRRFEKKTYSRALTGSKNSTHKIQRVANWARQRGWNARVVKNKQSTSLFVRRRYNRPIPETDPLRAEVFPVALGAVLQSEKSLAGAFPKDFVSATNERMKTMAPKLDEQRKLIVREQVQEIKEFTDQLELHREELMELQRQSMQNLNVEGFVQGKSNLSEEQWNEIFNYQLGQDGRTILSELSDQVKNYAYAGAKQFVMSPDFIEASENELGIKGAAKAFSEMSGEAQPGRITDEDFINAINTPGTVAEAVYQVWLEMADEAVKEGLVLHLRDNGMSEHSLLASIKYPLISDSPLIYTEWDSWITPKKDVAIEKAKEIIRVEPIEKVDEVLITFPGIGGATVQAKIDRKITDSWLNAMRDGNMDVISLESIQKAYDRKLSDFTRVWSGDPYKGWNAGIGKAARSRGRKMQFVVDKPSDIEPTNIPSWVKKGDIVVSRIGGKVSFYDPANATNLPRNAIFIGLKPGEEKNYDLRALKYEIENRIGMNGRVGEVVPLMGSVQQALRVSELKALDLKAPPLQDQKQWAEVLAGNERVIDLQEQAIAKRRNMQEGLRRDPRVRPDFRKFSEVRDE
jgi:hypothetical protein